MIIIASGDDAIQLRVEPRQKELYSEDAAACRYPEPDEFKVDATHTCWVSYTKAGIHSKYAERIRRYKYRQGYRPAGAHPRVRVSIPDLA